MDAKGGIRLVDGEVRGVIQRLNEELKNILPYKLAVVNIEDLELAEKNARYMTSDVFQNLVQNIKRDGGLSSVPFCWKYGDKYHVLSGNHRVMAAKEAGLTELLILYTDRELSKQERIAIQLSHNAIEGKDDPVILRELWEEIEDVNLKFYAGLDDKTLKELEKVNIPTLSEVPLEYRTCSFVFLPEEQERLDEVFQKALELVPNDDVYLARLKDFDRLMRAIAKTSDSYNIRNAAVAIMLILDVFEKHLEDLAEGWEHSEKTQGRSWVPLASILGTDDIPVGAAQVIKEAVQKMMDRGEVTKKNLWQAIEYWAADYLAGED